MGEDWVMIVTYPHVEVSLWEAEQCLNWQIFYLSFQFSHQSNGDCVRLAIVQQTQVIQYMVVTTLPPYLQIINVKRKCLWYNVIKRWLKYLCIFTHKHLHKKGNEIKGFGRNGGVINYEQGLLLCIFFKKIKHLCMLLKSKQENPTNKTTYSVWLQLCTYMH